MPDKLDRAADAYRAYGEAVGWVNWQGGPMPTWDALPAHIQNAWNKAAGAAAAWGDK